MCLGLVTAMLPDQTSWAYASINYTVQYTASLPPAPYSQTLPATEQFLVARELQMLPDFYPTSPVLTYLAGGAASLRIGLTNATHIYFGAQVTNTTGGPAYDYVSPPLAMCRQCTPYQVRWELAPAVTLSALQLDVTVSEVAAACVV